MGFLIGMADFFTDIYYVSYVEFASELNRYLCIVFLFLQSTVQVYVMPLIYILCRDCSKFKKFKFCDD